MQHSCFTSMFHMFRSIVSVIMYMIRHGYLGCLMMHNMHDLQCLHAGITPGCYSPPPYKKSRPEIWVTNHLFKILHKLFCRYSPVSQVASPSSWWFHCILYVFTTLFRVACSLVSNTRTGCSRYTKSNLSWIPRGSILSSGTRKHFLRCDTWKTGKTVLIVSGNSNL